MTGIVRMRRKYSLKGYQCEHRLNQAPAPSEAVLSATQGAPRTDLLAVEPQPYGERYPEDDPKPREQRIAAPLSQRCVHLLAEQRESEA